MESFGDGTSEQDKVRKVVRTGAYELVR
jgi:hypothetical protein